MPVVSALPRPPLCSGVGVPNGRVEQCEFLLVPLLVTTITCQVLNRATVFRGFGNLRVSLAKMLQQLDGTRPFSFRHAS